MSENPLFNVWCARPAAPQTADPLAAIETAIHCLMQGEPVPEPAASLLGAALLRYRGGCRFDHALGLQGKPGKRSPVQAAAKAQRDSKLRAMAALLPGETQHEKAAAILKLLEGGSQPDGTVSPAELIADDLRLRQRAGWKLPKSVRQIERVLSGK